MSNSMSKNREQSFTSNKGNKRDSTSAFPTVSPSVASISSADLSKNEQIYGRQIAFVAAFLLPMSKLLEVPALLARFSAGDLLLPALLHFFLQFIVLGGVLFAVYRSENPLIFRLRLFFGKFLPIFYILYAFYYLFASLLVESISV